MVDIVVVLGRERLLLMLHHRRGLGHERHVLHGRSGALANWHVEHSGLQVGRLGRLLRLVVDGVLGGVNL